MPWKTKTVGAAVAAGASLGALAYAASQPPARSTPERVRASGITVVQGPSPGTGHHSTWAATIAPAVAAPPLQQARLRSTGFFSFGVQTHFSQGWSPSWLGLADQIGARTLRDTVSWASVEKAPGSYDFSGAAVQTLASFCTGGGKLILAIAPENSLYDDGRPVHSDAGRIAYARYLNAVLARFGACVTAIEVGNEINNAGNLAYPAGTDRARTYVASLKTLRQVVKPAHPEVAILGGSTNGVGTGFLETLFAAGGLAVMDGVAVHPYRGVAEGLDVEIQHLRDVMRRYGSPVPIWATEFSYDTTDKAAAAAGLVKSAAQLSASGVDHASWYALVDQKWFPNMGLFAGTSIKPTGLAYAAIVQRLFTYGRAVRVNAGDSLTYLYRFGAARWLAWGAPRTLTFSGAPIIRDIYGTARAGASVQLGSEPVIVEGASGFTAGPRDVVADTMLQYGQSPWSYYRRSANNKDVALSLFDNDYTSFFGDQWSKPLRVNVTSAAPAGTGASPMRAVIRYSSPKKQRLDLAACFSKTSAGDGVDYKVMHNGITVAGGILTDKAAISALPLDLATGDTIDLIVGPNQTYGDDSFSYRMQLAVRGRGKPLCS